MAVDLSAVAGMAINLGKILLLIIIAGAIVGGTLFIFIRYKRYNQYVCRIWEKDGLGQWELTNDKAGVFVKDNKKRLWLKKARLDMNPNEIPFVRQGKLKVIYMIRTGSKNYRFIKSRITDAGIVNIVGEEDVNWAITDFDRQHKQFGMSLWQQIMPFMIIAIPSICILIIFVFFFKNFGELQELGRILTEFAKEVAKAKAGTVVIG